ncbi:MAG: hypothetical protein DRJ03_01585 [Chloroflexi bacterium]|nr:MAG: hypothetical protein DRJ03_01585 [Chloroflexota bacterium]
MDTRVRLIDACFPGQPSSAGGENAGRHPQRFKWCRDNSCNSIYTWYTNWTLHQAHTDFHPRKVAWLWEPPSLQTWPYQYVASRRNLFDAIFTYDEALLSCGDTRFKLALHGGTWIRPAHWGMHEKTRTVCMFVSQKKRAVGHAFRHDIASALSDQIDVYGREINPVANKWDALKHYRYCIVVESIKMPLYFSEKLIDAMLCGCVPIYWGAWRLAEYFDMDGIINFHSIEHLERILSAIGSGIADYRARSDAVKNNLIAAQEFAWTENRIYDEHKEYFR